MTSMLPYILGALGGGGALCAYYGIRRVRDDDSSDQQRRIGLRLVNLGIVMIALSLAATLWGR